MCAHALLLSPAHKRLPAAHASVFIRMHRQAVARCSRIRFRKSTYIYIYIYEYIYTCMHIYIYICVCMRVHCSLVVKRLSAMCVLAGYEAVVRYVVVKRLSAMYVRLSIDVVSDGVDVATTTAAVMVVLRSRPCVCACIAPMHYSCSRPTDPVWVPRRRWATRRMTTHSEEQRRRNMPCPACCGGCNSRRARAAPTMNRHRR